MEASFNPCEGTAVTDDSILLGETANVTQCISNEKMFSFHLLTCVGQIKKSESSCGIEQQTIGDM